MNRLLFRQVAALAFLLLGVLHFASASDVNGRIKGTVTDPAGGILVGAHVTATNEATGVKLETTSVADGTYLFPQVPVGTYTVSASVNGFKTFTVKGIVLNIDQEYVQPIQLTVGSQAETIEVQASAVQVDTTDMQLSNVVNSEQLVELPLITRNFTGLELTLPGVQASSDRFGTYSVAGGQTQQSEFLINGADTNDISLNTLAVSPNLDAIDQFNLIDGPLNAEYDRNSGGIVSATIKEGTNHFHGDGFEFYRDTFLNTLNFYQKCVVGSGCPVSTGTVAPYHQNIYGGTVGGPILHDKLFFFFAYQGTHQRIPDTNGSGSSSSVYDAANLNGDFSADDNGPASAGRPEPVLQPDGTYAIPAWGNWQPIPIPSGITIQGCNKGNDAPGKYAGPEVWSQCAYDLGGVMPTSAFNPIALALVNKYVPKPNNGTYGFLFNPVDVLTDNQYIERVDFSPSPTNQITALAIYDKSPNVQGLPFTGATLPGFGDVSTHIIQQYTGDYVHQFNSTTVNDFAGHYTRFNYQAVEPLTAVDPASLGFKIHPEIASAANVPTISVGGTNVSFTLGWSTNGPQPRIDQVAQLDDTVSKVWGNHTFKFGYDGRRFNVHNPFGAQNSGNFGFGGSPYTTGDGGVDFLLGIPATYGQGSGASIIAESFLNYVFAQDTWKLTPSFTLSYGIGYSIDTPLRELQYGGNAIACIIGGENSTVFSAAPTSMVYGGDKGCTNAGQATTRYSELGPRVGFAWAPDLGAFSGAPGKFSVRGGFGIYYDRTEEETALQTLETPPFGISSGGVGQTIGGAVPTFADPYTDINGLGSAPNPFPYTFPTKGSTINFAALEPIIFSTYGPNFRAPYAENIQLSVEREFPSRIVARASYVGSLARHNQSTIDANPITPAGHAACVADTTDCGYTGYTGPNTIFREEQSYFFPNHTTYGQIDPASGQPGFLSPGDVSSYASSSYHSLQASVEKGTTHGLTFHLSYTWSHAMDTGSSFENAGFGGSFRGFNQYAPQLNIGDSGFDARQRLVFSPIYITPLIPGKSEYSPINLALGGWEVSAITTLASGFPFDVSYGGSSGDSLWCPGFVYYYACSDAPNQVAPITKGNPRSSRLGTNGHSAYISKTSFVNEPIGEFGNTHRDPAHGPGINFTNMILAKNFYLSKERGIRLQLRMESDNVFNHTSFGNPGAGWSDTTLTNTNSTFGQISGINGGSSARLTQLATKVYF